MKENKYITWCLKLLPILIGLILALIIYHPVFFSQCWAVNKTDALQIHLPVNNLIIETFRNHNLPLWNPYFNLGQPILDGFSLIFHPALILYAFFNPWLANSLEIIIVLILTFSGAWYFLKQQGFSRFATSIGSFVYTLCGPVFFLHSYHLDLTAISLLPWILWAFHRYDIVKTSKWLWISACFCLLAVQSIEPDSLFYLFVGLTIDRFACIPQERRRPYLIVWAGILILTILTGLLTYLPLYEWLYYSSRLTKTYSNTFHPSFSNMITAVFTNQWLTYWPYASFYFYFGPAVFWLALAGFFELDKKNYVYRYFSGALIIPIYYFVMRYLQPFELNKIDVFRGMFVFCLSLAMISAKGVGNILKGGKVQLRVSLLVGWLTMALASWAIFSGTYTINKCVVLSLAAVSILISVISMIRKVVILRIFGIFVAVVATLLGSAYFFAREDRHHLISRNSSITQRKAFYSYLRRVEGNGEEAHWRITTFGFTDNTSALARLKSIPNYTTFYNQAMENILLVDNLIQRNTRLPYWMSLSYPDAQALGIFGVKFLITLGDDNVSLLDNNSVGWTKRPDLDWYFYSVWENNYYIGRAFFLNSSGKRYSGEIEFLEDAPEEVVLKVNAQDGDSLVLADLSYPGWEAWVDGRRAPAEVYHGCLRMLRLTQGEHIIAWKYNGRIQRVGLILSLVALSILLLFLATLSFFRSKNGNLNR